MYKGTIHIVLVTSGRFGSLGSSSRVTGGYRCPYHQNEAQYGSFHMYKHNRFAVWIDMNELQDNLVLLLEHNSLLYLTPDLGIRELT